MWSPRFSLSLALLLIFSSNFVVADTATNASLTSHSRDAVPTACTQDITTSNDDDEDDAAPLPIYVVEQQEETTWLSASFDVVKEGMASWVTLTAAHVKEVLPLAPQDDEEGDSVWDKAQSWFSAEALLGATSETKNDEGEDLMDRLVAQNSEILLKYLQRILPQDSTNLDVLEAQLRAYVATIASLYNHNPFHNFEHAAHVTSSVDLLLTNLDSNRHSADLPKHVQTLQSDPLISFALVFTGLVHDVYHEGVPNAQLVQEGSPIAEYHQNQSVAENQSLHMALTLLETDAQFGVLRETILGVAQEHDRFQYLVQQALLATDIADKTLRDDRQRRWRSAFGEEDTDDAHVAAQEENDKVIILMEHLMQVADVFALMEDWDVYQKWNVKLFQEMHCAYAHGRAAPNHPADFWYNFELGFFDFYIIPLAKRLPDLGFDGSFSEKHLNYAVQNRAEWVERGKTVTAEFASLDYDFKP